MDLGSASDFSHSIVSRNSFMDIRHDAYLQILPDFDYDGVSFSVQLCQAVQILNNSEQCPPPFRSLFLSWNMVNQFTTRSAFWTLMRQTVYSFSSHRTIYTPFARCSILQVFPPTEKTILCSLSFESAILLHLTGHLTIKQTKIHKKRLWRPSPNLSKNSTNFLKAIYLPCLTWPYMQSGKQSMGLVLQRYFSSCWLQIIEHDVMEHVNWRNVEAPS